MNILVLGGAGFLGANLVRRCLQHPDNRVTVLDSLEPRLRASTDNLCQVWDRVRFVRGNLCDETLMADIVQQKEVIFNCAAQSSHPLSMQDPILDAQINCLGNLRLLESLRLLNKSATVVYASSSTVTGKALKDVVDEEHLERPLDIYSANKGVAEKYYTIYNRVHGLKTVVLRFANLYGPYGKGYPEFGFINYFLHQAWTGQEVRVYGTGNQLRNCLYVEDAADILYQSAMDQRLSVGEVFFATHHEHHSVLEVAQAIVRVLKRGTLVHVEWPEERRRIEIDDVRISSAKLRSITGWHPKYSLESGLARTREILLELLETPRLPAKGG